LTYLPGILGQIATVTSEATALILARELGGTSLKLSAHPRGKLAKLVGVDHARAMVEEWSQGFILVIPMANLRGRGARRAQVARMIQAGMSINQAAMAGDVHSRTAKRIKAALKNNAADLPLFSGAKPTRG
jgi:hypothetical protein